MYKVELTKYLYIAIGVIAFVFFTMEIVQSFSKAGEIAHAPDVKPPKTNIPGETWLRSFDGMEMVYVPTSKFLMGGNLGDEEIEDDELPQHEVTIRGFWIDRTEVTNRMFTNCVDEGICSTTIYAADNDFNKSDYPVVGVEWANAANYCEWIGGRLPTEAEWEFAAKGRESLIYPWGNVFDGSLANYCDSNCTGSWKDSSYDDGFALTAPTGNFSPEGDSWVGAADLVGNVWEWTSDWYADYANPTQSGEIRVIRGGSWISIAQGIRTTNRSDNDPEVPLSAIGFRCVVDELGP